MLRIWICLTLACLGSGNGAFLWITLPVGLTSFNQGTLSKDVLISSKYGTLETPHNGRGIYAQSKTQIMSLKSGSQRGWENRLAMVPRPPFFGKKSGLVKIV